MIVLKAKIAPILHHDIPPLLNPYFMDAMEEKIGRQRPITHGAKPPLSSTIHSRKQAYLLQSC